MRTPPFATSITRISSRRAGVLLISVALVASILGASSAVAEEPTPPSTATSDSVKPTDPEETGEPWATKTAAKLVRVADSDDDKLLDAPDTASAEAAAAANDEPVEDLSERTETSTVAVNPDGTRTLEQHQVPVRVKRDGEWLDVDSTLTKQDDGTFRPKVAAGDVVIGGGGSKTAGMLTLEDGHSVTVTWPETLPVPSVEGNVATYKLSEAADLLMIAAGNGVAARLRLNEKPAADDPVFTFGLQTDDLTVTETPSGGLAMKDDQGKTLAATTRLVAWDAKTDEAGAPLEKVALDATLDETARKGDISTHALDLTAPEGYLADPDTVYPVVIDPDVQFMTANSDTFVRQNDTDDHGGDFELRVGKTTTTGNVYPHISYIKWNMDRIPAGSQIVSSEINLWQFSAGICTAATMQVQPLSSNWAPSVLFPGRPQSLSVDYQYPSASRGNQCGNAGDIAVPATTWVTKWIANRDGGGGYPNYGLRFGVKTENETQADYGRRFCSYQVGLDAKCPNDGQHDPSLKVTYNLPTAPIPTPTNRSPITPQDLDVTLGGNPVSVYAKISDHDGETALKARITVKKAGSTTTVFEGNSNSVNSGPDQLTQVVRRLPYLPDGKYEVTATAVDTAGATSGATSSKEFVVETEFGNQSWLSTTPHRLNDRSNLTVNNRTGNLVVQSDDIDVNGLGLDFRATRFYNSQSVQTNAEGVIPAADRWYTSLGTGWSLSAGPDVWMQKEGTYFYYHGPGGTIFGPFTPDTATKFMSPKGGVGADLSKETSDGTTVYTLKFRESGLKYLFQEYGSSGHLFQKRIQDKSDNKIEFNYASTTTPNGRAKLTSIKDASGRDYTVAYTGDYISKITNTSDLPGSQAQAWTYAYESDGRLKSYTNPGQEVTSYQYVRSTATGAYQLSTITDPGTDVRTSFVYFGNTGNADRIDQVSYKPYSYESDSFGWDYKRRTAESYCNSGSDYSTTVRDARSKDTYYCFNNSAGADDGGKVRVYDATPDHNLKTTAYTADKGIKSVTTPSNQGDSSSITNNYNQGASATFTDRLNSVTEPRNDGATTESLTQLNYGAEPAAGTEYLPRSIKKSDGNCSAYEYDSRGRTTAAYTGIISATNSCAKGNKIGSHRRYNSNGTLSESWDANAYDSTDPARDEDGEEPTQARKTIYTYWSSTDAGLIANTSGQLKTVRKPGGSCDAPRKLCTSYTYDLRGNVASMTDGRGIKTSYVYDKMDRTVETLFDGATVCNPSTPGNCTRYTYDAKGNLTFREDKGGTTQFTYDGMNRLTRQSLFYPGSDPDGLPDTQVEMRYDGNGNLWRLTQRLVDRNVPVDNPQTEYDESEGQYPWIEDRVDYSYDSANRLTNVHSDNIGSGTAGDIGISPNADGRVQQIRTASGLRMNYNYTKFGKPKNAIVNAPNDQEKRRFNYNYKIPVGGDTVMTDKLRERDITLASNGGTGISEDIKYAYADEQLVSATSNHGPNFDYTHDKIGNIRSETSQNVTTYFGYDRAGQLCWRGQTDSSNLADTCGNGPAGSTNFNHDATGNNTNIASNPTTYNNDSQVTTIDGVAMSYEDSGNGLRTTAGAATYLNTPLGVTAKKTGTDITFYVRDPNGQLLASTGAGGTRFYFSEFNGSVAAIYDTAGDEVGSYTYSPYGKTTVTGTAAQNNPFRYIGGLQDKDSQGNDTYYKLGARYYDAHGHFTQADPNIPGGGSYNYTEGDPINKSDPSGLISWPTPPIPDYLGAIGDAWAVTANCAFNGATYLTDSGCRATVNGVAASTAVTSACASGTMAPTVGGSAGPCLAIGTIAGWGAAGITTWTDVVLDELL
jgi:RHS repeat-associated protein